MLTAIIVMIGVSIGNRDFWSYYPPKYWSKLICFFALCPITVKRECKLDEDQSYIFVPNHQSIFDIFLIYGFLDQNIKWVQKKELRQIPLVGKASEMAGHVFLEQRNLKSMSEGIKEIKQKISKGISMVIFPEGARSRTGKIARFKRGPFIIAQEMNLPVVPITINGAYEVMKIGTFILNPHKMELIIHKPILPTDESFSDLQNLITKSQDAVISGLWAKYKNELKPVETN